MRGPPRHSPFQRTSSPSRALSGARADGGFIYTHRPRRGPLLRPLSMSEPANVCASEMQCRTKVPACEMSCGFLIVGGKKKNNNKKTRHKKHSPAPGRGPLRFHVKSL